MEHKCTKGSLSLLFSWESHPVLSDSCANLASTDILIDAEALNGAEKDALRDFYESTGGINWYISDSWGEGHPCSHFWYGIQCDCWGNVISIRLPDNRLVGEIPPSISSLIHLKIIDLHSSPSAGTFSNYLTGPLPSLANLVDLQVLDISLNAISQWPNDIFLNRNLEVFSASQNLIGELPVGIGEFVNLRVFELDDNLIESQFPTGEVCSMKSILILNLGNNTITGPFYDGCLTNLNPLVVDLSAHVLFGSDQTTGLDGDVPANLISSWTNIDQGYVSFYLQPAIGGHFGAVCSDLRFCFWYNFRGHGDLSSSTKESEIPQNVFITISIAST